jgi:catechol 2,3-dioxygenase-like lactoylglutathione lyase family enzyme
MMPVVGLGHTGLWVHDLEKMRDFYERVIGLTVTDEDDEQGIVFFSAQPDVEHHEFVLQRGRTAPPGSKLPHQISWRVDSVETLQMYHHRPRLPARHPDPGPRREITPVSSRTDGGFSASPTVGIGL